MTGPINTESKLAAEALGVWPPFHSCPTNEFCENDPTGCTAVLRATSALKVKLDSGTHAVLEMSKVQRLIHALREIEKSYVGDIGAPWDIATAALAEWGA